MSNRHCAPVPPLTLSLSSRPSSRGLSSVPAVLPRRTLRQILNRALGTPSQLDAFLIDYFPDIFRQTSGSMDREEKLNQLLKADSDTHLTSLVHREYPQQVADTLVEERRASLQLSGPDPDVTVQATAGDPRIRYTVVITGTIDDMHRHIIEALLRHMRHYACDAELTIDAIRQGSVILTCCGTPSGMQRLLEAFEQGRLTSLLDFPIADIVQNLPSTQVPQLRVRKSKPPLQDSRITDRLSWPTVAQRIEEITTQRLQPQTLTQSMAAPGTDRAQPVPGRVITSNDSAGHCWQHEDTRRMQLPKPRWSLRRAAITSVAACIGLVLALTSWPVSQPQQKSFPQMAPSPAMWPDPNGEQHAMNMSLPTELALSSPSRMAELQASLPSPRVTLGDSAADADGPPLLTKRDHAPVVKRDKRLMRPTSHPPIKPAQSDSIIQECVQLTFPMKAPGDWLLARQADGYVQLDGPHRKQSRKLPRYVLDAISRCLRWQSKASAIQLPPTLRIKVYRSVQDEGGLHIVVDSAASGINSNL